jgi:hypothetical protein
MKYLIGPELFWAILYGGATLLGYLNQPPSKQIDAWIDRCWFWIPVLSLLVFALWWIPLPEKRGLLLRVWIAGIFGGHFVMERTMRAYSEQGPGSGMGYLAGMIFLLLFMLTGTIFIKIRF